MPEPAGVKWVTPDTKYSRPFIVCARREASALAWTLAAPRSLWLVDAMVYKWWRQCAPRDLRISIRMTVIPCCRATGGPPVLSPGLRPLLPLAVLALRLWPLMFAGQVETGSLHSADKPSDPNMTRTTRECLAL